MAENEDSIKAEREADVDRLWKKMSVEKHEKLKKDMRDLVTRFRLRGKKYESKVGRKKIFHTNICCYRGLSQCKEDKVQYKIFFIQILRPPTPAKVDFDDLDDVVEKKLEEQEKRPLINYEIFEEVDPYKSLSVRAQIFKRIFDPLAINPQSWHMTILMGLQTIFVMYNAWSIPFGFSFTFYRVNNF